MDRLPLTGYEVDLRRRVVYGEGTTIRLTSREAELLGYLAARPGTAVSRDELLSEVWGYGPHTVTRAVDDTMKRLRPKIEADPRRPLHLITQTTQKTFGKQAKYSLSQHLSSSLTGRRRAPDLSVDTGANALWSPPVSPETSIKRGSPMAQNSSPKIACHQAGASRPPCAFGQCGVSQPRSASA